uniref:Dolichyl-diphosphooligosaccharide--protein glycosyltransferase subunit KCP2 n=1 Tax=Daphnia galeata TaxID=27404 RepID=A0A8J2RA25_9CRUS|nr:unnamed protein product [Daphnia galeata]
MAISSSQSFLVASVLSLLVFSGMQMYKHLLVSSQPLTLFGGFLGSVLFSFILTAVGNLEATLFGKSFQMKLFPEVLICLGIALTASGMVHRICTTVCLVLSLVHLYHINLLSQKMYGQNATVQTFVTKKRK